MFIAYMTILGVFILVFLCTISYRRDKRKYLNKKEHRLFLLYGMSMFFVDKIPKKYLHRKSSVNHFIAELSVKEDISREQYFYTVKKVSICFSAIMLTAMLGAMIELSQQDSGKKIEKLKRDNLNDTSYSFLVKEDGGEIESVVLNLEKREMSQKEIKNFLMSKTGELKKEVLAQNKDENHITTPLNFISSLVDENIFISWEISDSKIVGYDGQIATDISKEGATVSVTATMTYRKVSQDYTFSLRVERKENKSLEAKLQSFVDENGLDKKEIVLPKEIDGKKITYISDDANMSGWIFPIGILLSVSLFFLKDKDLKKQAEERNAQLERDYPEIINQILLYYGTGISLKSTIERIVSGYRTNYEKEKQQKRYVYEEMELMLTKMKSGISEVVALNQFGERCGLQCYIKLAGIIEQNLRRGTGALNFALKTELNTAMSERKNRALKEGSKISTKLLGPMMVLLLVAMVIIMAPAMLSMSIN